VPSNVATVPFHVDGEFSQIEDKVKGSHSHEMRFHEVGTSSDSRENGM